MLNFVLEIEENSEKSEHSGRILSKDFEWPIIPRQGELIGGYSDGLHSEVIEVRHDILSDSPKIYVAVSVQHHEFQKLLNDSSWERSWNED